MERKVAQGREPDARREWWSDPAARRWLSVLIGAGLVIAAFAAYAPWKPPRSSDHFVWQAQAFLEGEGTIDCPEPCDLSRQDVMPVLDADGFETGRGILPFPPLPALLITPAVAVWGEDTDQQAIALLLGALVVGICWWMLGRLPIGFRVRVATTIFFALGTVFWYAAMLGTTWYFAHIVAVGFGLLAVGVAAGSDLKSLGPEPDEEPFGWLRSLRVNLADGLRRPRSLIDSRQVLAGFLLGLAATARLPVVFAAPLLILAGSGGSWLGRTVSAAIGGVIPVGALVLFNLASTGQPLNPAYQYLYVREAIGYPELNYNVEWDIEDPRYLAQNLGIMLLSSPVVLPARSPDSLGPGDPYCTEPGAVRRLFERDCPLAVPRDTGMSLLLTSPAYLLALPFVRRLYGRSRFATGAIVAILLIVLINLMHFSQGWVQFGYRFSNDFVFIALPLVALAIQRGGWTARAAPLLIGASVAVNFWGVAWGNLLGW